MTSNVDDGTEATDSVEFLVYALASVAIVMSPNLTRGGFSNVMHHIVTVNGKFQILIY